MSDFKAHLKFQAHRSILVITLQYEFKGTFKSDLEIIYKPSFEEHQISTLKINVNLVGKGNLQVEINNSIYNGSPKSSFNEIFNSRIRCKVNTRCQK